MERLPGTINNLRPRTASKIPESLKRRIFVAQLTARSRLAKMMCVAGAVVAFTYFLSFTPAQRTPLADFGAACILLMYLLMFLLSQHWLAAADKPASYVPAMRRMIALQVLLGVSWSVLMVSAVHGAGSNERSMVYALAIALMSTTMVSGPAKYAFAFWLPVTLGAFVTLWSDPAHFYLPVFVALISYTVLTAYSILSMNHKLFEREINLFDVERHSATIQLLLRDFQDGSGSFLWETDATLKITELTANRKLLGDSLPDPAGMDFVAFVTEVAAQGGGNRCTPPEPAIGLIAGKLADATPFKEVILKQNAPNGTVWWAISGKPIFDERGTLSGFRGLWSDVTDREDYKNALQFAANRDYLTKVFNRAAFNEMLVARCRDGGEGASLLCVDLDYFKRVNDNFGHNIGDELLVAVAHRLAACVRPEDHVFRLGGDEFAIILTGGGLTVANAVATRILDQLCQPFVVNNVRLQIGASLGIALIPTGGADPDTLHRRADSALYRSKSNGKCSFTLFDEAFENPVSINQAIETDTRSPIPLDEFFLVYQPIVELETRRIIGGEALLRWRHPRLGILSPGDFIPFVEKTGQIANVGMFALEQAMSCAAQLRPGLVLSINISPIQLADIDLPRKIAANLAAAKLRPNQIEFEITESSLLERDIQKLEVLQNISKLGCGIVLDDFGTGYASLLLLDQFPFSKIKIDGSFVREHGYDTRGHLILTSMIRLATDLGIRVAAEGIETAGQARNMHQLGCYFGQGYYFHRALPTQDFLDAASLPDIPILQGSIAI